jgi:hypothetical protein
MKLLTAWATVVFAMFIGRAATGTHGPLPLDRPTPPPCCADGRCSTNHVWGVYETRWRRWPGVTDAPLEPSAAPAPGELGPAVPPYEAPPAAEEDQRAPAPTRPRPPERDLEEERESDPGATPTARPETAPSGPLETGPFDTEPFDTGPFDTESLEESPLEDRGLPTMPWDEPTSEADPPPAPPFALSSPSPGNQPARAAVKASATMPTTFEQPASVRPLTPPAHDPPPPLPLAFR